MCIYICMSPGTFEVKDVCPAATQDCEVEMELVLCVLPTSPGAQGPSARLFGGRVPQVPTPPPAAGGSQHCPEGPVMDPHH